MTERRYQNIDKSLAVVKESLNKIERKMCRFFCRFLIFPIIFPLNTEVEIYFKTIWNIDLRIFFLFSMLVGRESPFIRRFVMFQIK